MQSSGGIEGAQFRTRTWLGMVGVPCGEVSGLRSERQRPGVMHVSAAGLSPRAVVLNVGSFVLRRLLAMSGDSFHCYSLERGATGIQWVEVKGSTPHPIGIGHLQSWLLGLQGPDEKMAFDLIDTDLSSL